MRHSLIVLTAAVALGLAASAGAQTIGYNVRTGDLWVDNRLGEINDYGNRYRDPFVNEMVTTYGAPRPYVNDLLVTRHWSPGDVYYACALAHSMGRPCSEIVEEHERDHGQGWGVTAQRLGIKPGSREFFALKNGVAGSYGRWGHPVVVDREEHVRWDDRGDGDKYKYKEKSKMKYAHGHEMKYKHGDGDGNGDEQHGHGHGNGHGKGNDMDGGHDQSDDKGHGHGNGQGNDKHGHGHK